MQLSWDLIRSFQAVADTGSLSAAARKLGLTQPTVGRHIDLIEDQLNMSLFLRGRDGMRLTDKGADLLASAAEMASTATAFERRAAGLEDDIAGPVRISANEIFGVMILPGILTGLLDAHPGLAVELVVDNSPANLTRRDADIALRLFRPTQNDLIARKIADLPLGLYAHRDHIATHGAPESLQDLRHHRFIGFDRDTSLIDAARTMGLSLTPADFAFRCDNILAHIAAIRAGLGIGVTHRGLAARWPELLQVLPEAPLPSLPLWLACHADIRHNKRIRLTMEALAERLATPYAGPI